MEYRVHDGARPLTFEGELLSETTSARKGASRWTELALYKSVSGKYIVTQVGMSRVLHDKTCKRARGRLTKSFVEAHPDDDPNTWDMHDECVGGFFHIDDLVIEDTRYTALICDTADAAIESMHRDNDGVRSLSWLASELFEKAAMKDRQVADAFFTESRV